MTSPTNTDESKVRTYSLPDPLQTDQTPLTDKAAWFDKRHPEILRIFENEVYGKTPDATYEVNFKRLKRSDEPIPGASLEEIELTVSTPQGTLKSVILLAVPSTPGPHPVFLGLNFNGNHTTHPSSFITITDTWVRPISATGTNGNRATEKGRGVKANGWPIARIVERGYAVATVYCGDFDPDVDDGFQNGVHPLFYRDGQTKPESHEWATIGAWAWGLSRMVDYVHTDARLDSERIIAIGHSRMGKTALWAAAQDPRIAMVISNNSGCTGASLSRRNFGESIERINHTFPHWFCENYKKYSNNEVDLPIDQHMLLALIAPRPLYVASASKDLWADPKGEWLSVLEACKVYNFLGYTTPDLNTMPAPGNAVCGRVSYHIREGTHSITPWDWEHFMNTADHAFEKT